MKRFLLVPLLALLGFAPANAQPNPTFGVLNGVSPIVTYSAVALALPSAASATDIACISGAAGKTITVNEIAISGTAGTLVSAPFTLVHRDALNTGGTAATTTANWANTISKMVSTSPTPTATLISYSANPTITDSTPQYVRSAYVTIPVTSAGTSIAPIVWRFGTNGIGQNEKPTLRNGQTAQQFCINLNAVTIASPLLHLSIEWGEQ